MWYKEFRNGGLYHMVGGEAPVPQEMSNLLDSLMSKGIKFRVYYTDFELDGYTNVLGLINDETLEEVYVYQRTCWGHCGEAYWRIKLDDGQEVYNSKTGLLVDLLQKAIVSINKEIKALPIISEWEIMWRKKEWEYLHTTAHVTTSQEDEIIL